MVKAISIGLALLFVAYTLSLVFKEYSANGIVPASSIVLFLVAVLVTAILSCWDRLFVIYGKKYVNRKEGKARVFGEHTVELGPKYIQTIYPNGASRTTEWSAVQQVEITDNYLIILAYPPREIVIPRATLVGASFDQVIAAVDEYRRQAA